MPEGNQSNKISVEIEMTQEQFQQYWETEGKRLLEEGIAINVMLRRDEDGRDQDKACEYKADR